MKSELRRLHTHLLPANWNPTDTYTARQLDRTRAYKILAHAEVESFVEDAVFDVVEAKYNDWNGSKKPHYVIVRLVAASMGGWADEETESLGLTNIPSPSKKKLLADPDPADLAIHRAFEQYKNIVTKNHGIKEQNLKRLLMPAGITMAQLDPVWLADMESFGGARGTVAHQSRSGIQLSLNPRDEKQTVDRLVVGLSKLDMSLAHL